MLNVLADEEGSSSIRTFGEAPQRVVSTTRTIANASSITGCLLGTAAGDAIGLPAEGLSRSRLKAFYGTLDQHKLLFGRGMISDDTEHTCLVTEALIASAGDSDAFTCHFASGLRRWILLLPAGVGLATLRACFRLVFFVPPHKSGVYSAGNGPAMRSAILGVAFGDDLSRLRQLVRASTRITHTDPKAEYGAFAVALLAARFAQGQTDAPGYFTALTEILAGEEAGELLELVKRVGESIARGETTPEFAVSLGCGERVSGYVYQTAPVALHAALCYPDEFREAIVNAIACGGDTDTVAAIVGGIVGAQGAEQIPSEWRSGILEWGRNPAYLERLAALLANVLETGRPEKPSTVPFPVLALRNFFFTGIVLTHGFRRLLPPY